MSRKIEVQILGDSKSLEAALGKAQAKTSKFGSALAVGTKVAAGAFVGLGLAAKVGFDEINDAQKVAAQTAAVIKSTGGAANVTAKQVDALSQSLLAKSGVDDEVIASGENMLLTFRNIHNEAGKGNDIFNQATKATLDLSVAMGKDMQSSAILVGKALNDPIKGMTALRRVGVSLSDGQEQLVKHLVETGHTAKAQKVILGELRKEFGGSAAAAGKTLSGQLGVLRESFADVAANLVTALLPAVQTFVGYLSSAAKWMKENEQATKLIVAAIAALAAGVIVVNAVYKAWSAVTKVVAAAQWLLNAALAANPVVLVVAAVIALGVALVIAYKKSETFRNIVNAAFNAVKAVAGAAVDFIRDHWKLLVALIPGIGPVLFLVVNHFKTLRNAAGAVLGFVHDKFQAVVDVIKSAYGWVQNLISIIGSLIDKITSLPSAALDKLSAIADKAGSVLGFGHVAGMGVSPGRGGVAVAGFGGRQNPTVIHLQLDGKTFYTAVVGQDKIAKRQTGRSLIGNA